MSIQVIRTSGSLGTFEGEITFSPFSAPLALDDFNVNIIDLNDPFLWRHSGSKNGVIDQVINFYTIKRMVENKKSSIVLYAFPQNLSYHYNLQYMSAAEVCPLKDVMGSIMKNSLVHILEYSGVFPITSFERTKTRISEKEFFADFHFETENNVITKSQKSEKSTTISLENNIYATTLDFTKDAKDIILVVKSLFEKSEKEACPEWVEDIVFFDDITQKELITESNIQIDALKQGIEKAEDKLADNLKYKSILYTNGNELVSVVFEILEKILACDLSDFDDVRKEDFLIKSESCTFIGEIKGVTSNVKFEHISQIELHYRSYLDKLTEENKTEKVKQILIINPFRNKPLEERTEIHADQIALAKRNDCLIIETHTLLRMFENFLSGHISTQQCKDIFENRNGLLTMSDFGNGEWNTHS